jgi:hypothetical protein
MSLKKAMYDTALAEFESKRDKALATARIYMENPVGIGEHPQVIDEQRLSWNLNRDRQV